MATSKQKRQLLKAKIYRLISLHDKQQKEFEEFLAKQDMSNLILLFGFPLPDNYQALLKKPAEIKKKIRAQAAELIRQYTDETDFDDETKKDKLIVQDIQVLRNLLLDNEAWDRDPAMVIAPIWSSLLGAEIKTGDPRNRPRTQAQILNRLNGLKRSDALADAFMYAELMDKFKDNPDYDPKRIIFKGKPLLDYKDNPEYKVIIKDVAKNLYQQYVLPNMKKPGTTEDKGRETNIQDTEREVNLFARALQAKLENKPMALVTESVKKLENGASFTSFKIRTQGESNAAPPLTVARMRLLLGESELQQIMNTHHLVPIEVVDRKGKSFLAFRYLDPTSRKQIPIDSLSSPQNEDLKGVVRNLLNKMAEKNNYLPLGDTADFVTSKEKAEAEAALSAAEAAFIHLKRIKDEEVTPLLEKVNDNHVETDERIRNGRELLELLQRDYNIGELIGNLQKNLKKMNPVQQERAKLLIQNLNEFNQRILVLGKEIGEETSQLEILKQLIDAQRKIQDLERRSQACLTEISKNNFNQNDFALPQSELNKLVVELNALQAEVKAIPVPEKDALINTLNGMYRYILDVTADKHKGYADAEEKNTLSVANTQSGALLGTDHAARRDALREQDGRLSAVIAGLHRFEQGILAGFGSEGYPGVLALDFAKVGRAQTQLQASQEKVKHELLVNAEFETLNGFYDELIRLETVIQTSLSTGFPTADEHLNLADMLIAFGEMVELHLQTIQDTRFSSNDDKNRSHQNDLLNRAVALAIRANTEALNRFNTLRCDIHLPMSLRITAARRLDENIAKIKHEFVNSNPIAGSDHKTLEAKLNRAAQVLAQTYVADLARSKKPSSPLLLAMNDSRFVTNNVVDQTALTSELAHRTEFELDALIAEFAPSDPKSIARDAAQRGGRTGSLKFDAAKALVAVLGDKARGAFTNVILGGEQVQAILEKPLVFTFYMPEIMQLDGVKVGMLKEVRVPSDDSSLLIFQNMTLPLNVIYADLIRSLNERLLDLRQLRKTADPSLHPMIDGGIKETLIAVQHFIQQLSLQTLPRLTALEMPAAKVIEFAELEIRYNQKNREDFHQFALQQYDLFLNAHQNLMVEGLFRRPVSQAQVLRNIRAYAQINPDPAEKEYALLIVGLMNDANVLVAEANLRAVAQPITEYKQGIKETITDQYLNGANALNEIRFYLPVAVILDLNNPIYRELTITQVQQLIGLYALRDDQNASSRQQQLKDFKKAKAELVDKGPATVAFINKMETALLARVIYEEVRRELSLPADIENAQFKAEFPIYIKIAEALLPDQRNALLKRARTNDDPDAKPVLTALAEHVGLKEVLPEEIDDAVQSAFMASYPDQAYGMLLQGQPGVEGVRESAAFATFAAGLASTAWKRVQIESGGIFTVKAPAPDVVVPRSTKTEFPIVDSLEIIIGNSPDRHHLLDYVLNNRSIPEFQTEVVVKINDAYLYHTQNTKSESYYRAMRDLREAIGLYEVNFPEAVKLRDEYKLRILEVGATRYNRPEGKVLPYDYFCQLIEMACEKIKAHDGEAELYIPTASDKQMIIEYLDYPPSGSFIGALLRRFSPAQILDRKQMYPKFSAWMSGQNQNSMREHLISEAMKRLVDELCERQGVDSRDSRKRMEVFREFFNENVGFKRTLDSLLDAYKIVYKNNEPMIMRAIDSTFGIGISVLVVKYYKDNRNVVVFSPDAPAPEKEFSRRVNAVFARLLELEKDGTTFAEKMGAGLKDELKTIYEDREDPTHFPRYAAVLGLIKAHEENEDINAALARVVTQCTGYPVLVEFVKAYQSLLEKTAQTVATGITVTSSSISTATAPATLAPASSSSVRTSSSTAAARRRTGFGGFISTPSPEARLLKDPVTIEKVRASIAAIGSLIRSEKNARTEAIFRGTPDADALAKSIAFYRGFSQKPVDLTGNVILATSTMKQLFQDLCVRVCSTKPDVIDSIAKTLDNPDTDTTVLADSFMAMFTGDDLIALQEMLNTYAYVAIQNAKDLRDVNGLQTGSTTYVLGRLMMMKVGQLFPEPPTIAAALASRDRTQAGVAQKYLTNKNSALEKLGHELILRAVRTLRTDKMISEAVFNAQNQPIGKAKTAAPAVITAAGVGASNSATQTDAAPLSPSASRIIGDRTGQGILDELVQDLVGAQSKKLPASSSPSQHPVSYVESDRFNVEKDKIKLIEILGTSFDPGTMNLDLGATLTLINNYAATPSKNRLHDLLNNLPEFMTSAQRAEKIKSIKAEIESALQNAKELYSSERLLIEGKVRFVAALEKIAKEIISRPAVEASRSTLNQSVAKKTKKEAKAAQKLKSELIEKLKYLLWPEVSVRGRYVPLKKTRDNPDFDKSTDVPILEQFYKIVKLDQGMQKIVLNEHPDATQHVRLLNWLYENSELTSLTSDQKKRIQLRIGYRIFYDLRPSILSGSPESEIVNQYRETDEGVIRTVTSNPVPDTIQTIPSANNKQPDRLELRKEALIQVVRLPFFEEGKRSEKGKKRADALNGVILGIRKMIRENHLEDAKFECAALLDVLNKLISTLNNPSNPNLRIDTPALNAIRDKLTALNDKLTESPPSIQVLNEFVNSADFMYKGNDKKPLLDSKELLITLKNDIIRFLSKESPTLAEYEVIKSAFVEKVGIVVDNNSADPYLTDFDSILVVLESLLEAPVEGLNERAKKLGEAVGMEGDQVVLKSIERPQTSASPAVGIPDSHKKSDVQTQEQQVADIMSRPSVKSEDVDQFAEIDKIYIQQIEADLTAVFRHGQSNQDFEIAVNAQFSILKGLVNDLGNAEDGSLARKRIQLRADALVKKFEVEYPGDIPFINKVKTKLKDLSEHISADTPETLKAYVNNVNFTYNGEPINLAVVAPSTETADNEVPVVDFEKTLAELKKAFEKVAPNINYFSDSLCLYYDKNTLVNIDQVGILRAVENIRTVLKAYTQQAAYKTFDVKLTFIENAENSRKDRVDAMRDLARDFSIFRESLEAVMKVDELFRNLTESTAQLAGQVEQLEEQLQEQHSVQNKVNKTPINSNETISKIRSLIENANLQLPLLRGVNKDGWGTKVVNDYLYLVEGVAATIEEMQRLLEGYSSLVETQTAVAAEAASAASKVETDSVTAKQIPTTASSSSGTVSLDSSSTSHPLLVRQPSVHPAVGGSSEPVELNNEDKKTLIEIKNAIDECGEEIPNIASCKPWLKKIDKIISKYSEAKQVPLLLYELKLTVEILADRNGTDKINAWKRAKAILNDPILKLTPEASSTGRPRNF